MALVTSFARSRLLQYLLPGRCPLCSSTLREQETCLCKACVNELPWLKTQCQHCAVPLVVDSLCANCQLKPPSFRYCIAAFTYQTPIDNIIIGLKTDPYTTEVKQLSGLLANQVIDHYQRKQIALPHIAIPLPLHWRKMTQRGFNQSHIIGQLLAEHLLRDHQTQINLRTDLCERSRHSHAQHTLNKKQRTTSIKNAFALTPKSASAIKGLSIAVVDDVVTTNATANAIANTLLQAGAKQVDIWCLARTSWNNLTQ